MLQKKCSLCGGKLVNGKCTLCGLDSRRAAAPISADDLLSHDGQFKISHDFDSTDYETGYSQTDADYTEDSNYTYEYSANNTDSDKDFGERLKNFGNTLKEELEQNFSILKNSTSYQRNRSNLNREGHLDSNASSGIGNYSYNTRSSRSGSSHFSGIRKTGSKKTPTKGAATAVAIICLLPVLIGIFSVLFSMADRHFDFPAQDIASDFYEQVDGYSDAVDILPDTGDNVTIELTQGTYLGGTDIPCGTYTLEKKGSHGSLDVTDYRNCIFAYVDLGNYGYESTVTLENVNIYPSTIIQIDGNVSITLTSTNAQPYAIEKVPAAENSDNTIIMHQDEFKTPAPGLYTVTLVNPEEYGGITITRSDDNENYCTLEPYGDYQSTYNNLLITSNCTIEADGDIILTKVADYKGYTPDQIYRMYYYSDGAPLQDLLR